MSRDSRDSSSNGTKPPSEVSRSVPLHEATDEELMSELQNRRVRVTPSEDGGGLTAPGFATAHQSPESSPKGRKGGFRSLFRRDEGPRKSKSDAALQQRGASDMPPSHLQRGASDIAHCNMQRGSGDVQPTRPQPPTVLPTALPPMPPPVQLPGAEAAESLAADKRVTRVAPRPERWSHEVAVGVAAAGGRGTARFNMLRLSEGQQPPPLSTGSSDSQRLMTARCKSDEAPTDQGRQAALTATPPSIRHRRSRIKGANGADNPEEDEPWVEHVAEGAEAKRGFERMVARGLGHWGTYVARFPRLVVLFTVLLHVTLACGVRWASFESDSHNLYIAQRNELARERRDTEAAFGETPSPLIIVLRSKSGDEDVLSRKYMKKLLRLHSDITHLHAPYSAHAADDISKGHATLGHPVYPADPNSTAPVPAPPRRPDGTETVTFQQLCKRRYVQIREKDECIVVSPLQLWLYSEDMLDEDQDVPRTLSDAFREHTIDLGGRDLDELGSGPVAGAQAVIISYFLDVSKPWFWDGHAASWEASVRAHAQRFAEADDEVHVSFWSRHFNEEEASRFVKNDAYLIGIAFGVVLVYVSLSLSRWGCDAAHARYLLGCMSLACSGLSLASGLGIASLVGIPVTPISPLVCFTLLGVSVDDMIILTDAFDRIAEEERSRGLNRRPGARTIGGALYEIGGAVTMTTLTTAATFFTGWTCDLPIYAYFCGTASICVLVLYHIQMTLYAALLLLDARRRFKVVKRRDELSRHAASAHPPPKYGSVQRRLSHSFSDGELLKGGISPNGAKHAGLGSARSSRASASKRSSLSAEPGGVPRVPSLMKQISTELSASVKCAYSAIDVLLDVRTRVVVLLLYGALVGVAIWLAPHVNVGLPQRQTIADGSPIGEFLDDLDGYWSGFVPTPVMLVFRNTNVSDVEQVRGVQRVIDDTLSRDFVLRAHVDWIDRFGEWCACVRAERGDSTPLRGALPPVENCSIAEFLADGSTHEVCNQKAEDAEAARQEEDKEIDSSCTDKDSSFKRLSGGRPCSVAVSHCAEGQTGWRTVRRYCPRTCNVCPKKEPSSDKGKADGSKKSHEAAEPAHDDEEDEMVDVSNSTPHEAYIPREQRLIKPPVSAEGGRDLVEDVILANPEDCAGNSTAGCVVAAHRVVIMVLLPQVYMEAYDDWVIMQAFFSRHGVDGYVYAVKYEFAWMDANMVKISLRNLLTAAPIIGVCTSLFLHPLIAFFSVFAVASIDVILFGVMALNGVPLNVITLLSLLIALGARERGVRRAARGAMRS